MNSDVSWKCKSCGEEWISGNRDNTRPPSRCYAETNGVNTACGGTVFERVPLHWTDMVERSLEGTLREEPDKDRRE